MVKSLPEPLFTCCVNLVHHDSFLKVYFYFILNYVSLCVSVHFSSGAFGSQERYVIPWGSCSYRWLEITDVGTGS